MTKTLAPFVSLALLLISGVAGADEPSTARLELRKGDRVCLIGNTLAERMQYFGHVETLLHSQFPRHELVVRNLGFSADEVKFRPRSMNFGNPDQHLARHEADVVLAFFGFNESFGGEAGLPQFEADLREFVQHTLAQQYNGKSAPRLVLVSPIAHEDLGNPNLPDGSANNANLAIYTLAMQKVAEEQGIPFVDLFKPTRARMAESPEPWTFNGVHLSDEGYRKLAPVLMNALFGASPNVADAHYERIRAEVNEKAFQFFHRYRAVNGYYVYGERNRVWNNEAVMENERQKLDEMCAIRDRRIWTVAQGGAVPEVIDDSGTRPHIQVETNFKQPIEILPPEEAVKKFTVAEGYAVNLFASEIEFPELKNPVQFAFDGKGRLWVTTMPSYPGYKPPEKPNDKILILEDTDGDGRADKQTVFADGLHVPTGIEFGDGGVYVAQQPNLMFLMDTDGDDVADVRRLILHGFDTGDTHHAISAFTWGPGGGLYLHEGTFHHSAVETPYGPVRNAHGGIYRYEPTTEKFETFVHYNFANPWGHVFDRWGQNFVADASGGANYYATAFSMKAPQFTGQEDFGPFKFKYRAQMEQFFPKRVRPTAGCELVSSRHFPPEAQGNYLLTNVIGFQGILQHTVKEEGSGFVGKEIEPLLFSSDPNFRPIELQMGPDGALYVVDWFNPLIGHLQHSIRDPNRDHAHGRIWRITYPSRPLVKPAKIAGQPIPALLDLLKDYEDRTRYRARRELREHPAAEVIAALEKWIAGLDSTNADFEHHLLEALWVRQHFNAVDEKLLARVLRSPDYHARAAATRVLGYWRDQVDDSLELLAVQANDEHPRVRLEAVRASSFFEDPRAAEVALSVLKQPTDYYITYALRETMRMLEPYWKPAIVSGRPFATDNPVGAQYVIDSLDTSDLVVMARSRPVYEALLTRHGVPERFREESLHGLAKLNQTDVMSELVAAFTRLDQSGGEHAEHVLGNLAHLFTIQPAGEIARFRERIEELSRTAKQPITRRVALVALITADGTADGVWQRSLQSVESLLNFVEAVPLIPDDELRASTYEYVEPLLHGLPEQLAEQMAKQKGKQGRYVRIELPGSKRVLTLAEVEVRSEGRNIAPAGEAKQSSTGQGGAASRAIDGNSSGRFGDGSQTHTAGGEDNPWWEVDLKAEHPVESVTVWNRSENNGEYAKRLEGFTLTVLDANRQPVFTRKDIPAPPESVTIDVQGDPAALIRRSAIAALPAIPGHHQETFRTLAGFVKDDVAREAAVRALGRLPRAELPQAEVRPLIDALIAFVESVPEPERTRADVVEALQLGKDLCLALPEAEGRALFTRLRQIGVDVFVIRPVIDKMQFDRTDLFVEAGKPFEIILENIDIMPHNLVIVAPGAREEVGILAEKLGATPEAYVRQFVPQSDKVLQATSMLQSGQSERLQVSAPSQVGEYPFVCTFPGHWRTMYGTIHVVADISQVPFEQLNTPRQSHDHAHGLAETRPFIRKWSMSDLAGSLGDLDGGRSFENGQTLFRTVACASCHQMRGEGGQVGPDLTEVSKKLAAGKMDRLGLLSELVEPSKVIDEKFRTQVIVTEEGKLASGVVVYEDDQVIRLMANPLEKETKPQEIAKEAIEERTTSNISLMPDGLLNTLTRDDILDLLSYLESAGDPNHKAFAGGSGRAAVRLPANGRAAQRHQH